jgi:hypothetical protein
MLSAASSGISQPNFVLKTHSQLDSVEAIGAEIVDEISVFCYLISIDAEMFGDDAFNPVAESTHRFFEPSFFKDAESSYFARFTKSIKLLTRARAVDDKHLALRVHGHPGGRHLAVPDVDRAVYMALCEGGQPSHI